MKKTPDESYRLSARRNDLFPAELLPRAKHDVSGLQWLHGNLSISVNPIAMSRWKRSADNTRRSSKPSQHPTRSPQPAYAIILRANPPSTSLRFPFPRHFVKLIEHGTRGTQRLSWLCWPETHGKGTFLRAWNLDFQLTIAITLATRSTKHSNWDNIRTPY